MRATSKQEREAVETVLREFFDETPDGWRHARCDAEISGAGKKTDANRENGKRGGRPKKSEPSDNPEETHSVIPDETQSVSTGFIRARGTNSQKPEARNQEPEDPPAARVPPARAGDDSRPLTAKDLEAEGVDAQHAADWLKVRKAKKAPLTVTAWEATKREASLAGITPAKAVQEAAERGWQGFKASWLQRDQQQGRGSPAVGDVFAGAV